MFFQVHLRTRDATVHLSRGTPQGTARTVFDTARALRQIAEWESDLGTSVPGEWLRRILAPLLDRHDLWQLDDHALRQALAQDLCMGRIRVGVSTRTPFALAGGAKATGTTAVKGRTAKSTAASPAASTTTAVAPAWVQGEPSDFDDAVLRLQAASERIKTFGYEPKYSDAELMAMRDKGRVDDRFIVSVCRGPKSDGDVIGYKRASGRTTAWTTTFDQVEDGDLDPEILCGKMGMPYDRSSEYTYLIIDRACSAAEVAPEKTIVPTYDNITAIGKAEFVGDPEQNDPQTIEEVMTPYYSNEYEVHFEALISFSLARGGGPDKTYQSAWVKAFARTHFINAREQEKFLTRHKFTTEIGTNKYFTGNGLTKVTGSTANSRAGKKKFGALETLTIERNPPTIGQRKSQGGIRQLTLPPKVP